MMRIRQKNLRSRRRNKVISSSGFDIQDATADNITDCYRIRPRVRKRDPGYFETCLAEQRNKKRRLFIGYQDNVPCGYVHLIFQPQYQPFAKQNIPEIQDLYVRPKRRRSGLGRALVVHCEEQVKQEGRTHVGIGVGLYRDYGAAQRLYVRMGYVPDGAGVVYENHPVTPGEMRAVDDYLCLKLEKRLV